MSKVFKIGDQPLSISSIVDVLETSTPLALSKNIKKKIKDCRKYLDNKILSLSEPIYGINTGFGSLCNHKISDGQLAQLQKNLVLSHACGAGEEVPQEIVRIILLLKV